MNYIKTILTIAATFFLWNGCVTVSEGVDQPTIHSKLNKGRRLPHAEGEITVSSTSKSNNSIEIEIKNLVRPERLNPRAHSYVVWEIFNGDESKPQSVGALVLDKKFTGRIQTATPFRSFELFITVEPSMARATPSGEKLFWTSINH